jgi:hypothetical protein
MRRTSGRARDVRSWLITCSVLATFGCGPELAPPDPSNPLPPGIPADTGRYRQLIAQDVMSKNPHPRQRKAKCFLSLCSGITVTIEAVGNTLDIDPKKGPATPVRVAHLVNQDKKKTEKYYGLLPGDSAEYDLWVSRKSDSTTQWTLLLVSRTSNSVIAAKPADLNYCHLRGPNDPKASDADFAEYRKPSKCNYPIRPAAQKVSQASLIPTPVFGSFLAHMAAILTQFAMSDGGWIDCNNGCCT